MKKERQKLLKFGILFAALCGAFHVVILLAHEIFEPINEYTAKGVGILLGWIGLKSEVEGLIVSAGGFSIMVVDECSAIPLFILFSSFVLAYPSNFRNKAIGVLFGLPSLFVVNIFRLFFLFLSGLYYREIFDYVHVYLWQTVILIMIFVACLVWLEFVVQVKVKDTPSSFFLRFMAISIIPFLIWLFLNYDYSVLISKVAEPIVNAMIPESVLTNLKEMGYAGVEVTIPQELMTATFNFVPFIGLIFATRAISFSNKMKAMAIGLPIIVVAHVFFLVYNALTDPNLGVPYAFEAMLTVQLIGQYFLLFGIWLAFAYKDIFKRAGTYICPICGKEVVGIEEHVRKKHGKKALKKEEVMALLEAKESTFMSKVVEKLRLGEVVEQIRNRLKGIKRKEK